MRAVCVIGLGLIGGSVLRAASAAGRPAWGATASRPDADAARAEGFAVEDSAEDALRRAAAEDALVVVATPLTAVREVLRQVAWHAPEAWLTDVVSVKDPVEAEVRSLLPGAKYAGGHPMAGLAESGWRAGSAELFSGASWAVTIEDGTTAPAWREAAALAVDCGARVVPCSAAEHDSAVARVSHLPHVFAAVLAAVGADGGPLALSLAAGSFRDGTRVAGSAPDLVRAMTEGNRVALLDAVDDALGRLGAARGSLASTGSLKSTVDAGHEARRALEAAPEPRSLRVRLDEKGALDRLRDVGARGGRVVALDEDAATVEVP
ncbi:prephenate dehydrogenase [Saccharopolyspora erythraea NRRL 2338]|uniref:Prephenate dehydrogenase n=2 Tax=Saccharopolyspora erythraea TaxID=1836 RepID=A4F6A9_SACEN|nr:prephenate dehydrogenase [Saccharopolyspora erythraea]EQD88060.1 prephenate dehydrogenase [Saccharopolyspora erythraea D]PFG93385.1 prephenate dehydrogenase [Saccharopolyspora erythraea NRRL 2338]QRK90220.1 prephenate dehydrogenase [Saccharopolyspora erythraea]CAL99583.1 prephenate dehydrogenase [Saccharopolyspora erythraea NRRL 2338]